MIELAEGIWIAPEHVSMVKKVDDDKCLLYFVGQSALEGHLLPYAANEVAEALEDQVEENSREDDED